VQAANTEYLQSKTPEHVSTLNAFFLVIAAIGRKMNSIPAETRTLVQKYMALLSG